MKQKTPLSIKIIYWLTNFSFAILSLVLFATIALNILLYTTSFGDDFQLHTRFPAKVDFLEIGNLHINNQDIEVELVEATAKIHFIDTPKYISKRVAFLLLLVVSGAGYLTWVFRSFIKNVKNGIIFTIKNISLLKRMSYIIVTFWFFTYIYMRIFYYQISRNVEFKNIRIREEMDDNSGILIVALLIWVLAHIFISGLRLQKENDLTI